MSALRDKGPSLCKAGETEHSVLRRPKKTEDCWWFDLATIPKSSSSK